MPVLIHGKQYRTVSERVNEFREAHPDWTIQNSLVSVDTKTVVFKSEIYNDKGRLIASGHAEENRMASKINQTSALEVCETSAAGRALAFFGLAGDEIASANEVSGAIAAGKLNLPPDGFNELDGAKNMDELVAIWKVIYPKVSHDPVQLRAASEVKDKVKERLSGK